MQTNKKRHCERRISISHSVWFHRHHCRHFTKNWCHHLHTPKTFLLLLLVVDGVATLMLFFSRTTRARDCSELLALSLYVPYICQKHCEKYITKEESSQLFRNLCQSSGRSVPVMFFDVSRVRKVAACPSFFYNRDHKDLALIGGASKKNHLASFGCTKTPTTGTDLADCRPAVWRLA